MRGPYDIVPVQSRGEIREFLEVPWLIYRDDPNWIPHLKQDVEKVFDQSKNKAFAHGEAVRWILRDGEGRAVGRVAAFVDERTPKQNDQDVGGVGFFECIDDHEAARMLLDRCREWLEKRGMTAMDGPINFGERIAFWGLLIENFTDPPTYQLGYNPPYYRDLLEDFGFRLYYEQFVFKRILKGPAPDVFVRKSKALLEDPKFTMRTVRGVSNEKIANDFRTVLNDAWTEREGFKELSFDQSLRIIKTLEPVSDPDIAMFCYYEERPVAFYLNIPELNQIFKHVNGDLNLIGKLKFLWHKWWHTPDVMTGLVFGVVQDFQGKGVEGAMIRWCEDDVVPLKRYKETVLTWIGDFNPKMLKVCENLDATCYRKLATFRYLFDRDAPFERAPQEKS